jgi:Domain of unknown function (DUF1844)
MDKDIKSIIVLLATQAMINLGEIKDPMTAESNLNFEGADLFMKLLNVLEAKTAGNLTEDEAAFMTDIMENLDKVYHNKKQQG